MTQTAILEKAHHLMRAENWGEAIELLRSHETEFMENAEFASCFGWSHLKLDDCETAVRWLGRCVDLKPESAKHRWAFGQALALAERVTEAEQQLLLSLAMKDSYLARMSLAFLLHRTGRVAEAEAVHKEGIRLSPNDGRRLGAYADFLSDQGRAQEAEPFYARAKTAERRDDNDDAT